MQQVEELVQGVFDLLMKAYPESGAAAHYVIDDDNMSGLTSAQLISLSLKAPGLLVIPRLKHIKREYEESPGEGAEEPAVKRPKASLARNTPDSLQCKDCFDSFTNPLLLMKHMNSVHPVHTVDYARTFSPQPRASPHFSGSSSFSSPTRSRLQSVSPANLPSPTTAQREAYQKRPEFRKCMLCNVMFGSNEQLSAHLSSAHRNQKTYNCIAHSSCPMIFADIKSLRTHVYEVHIKECPVCKLRFGEECLALHLLKAHITLTSCPICAMQYPETQSLMLHIRTLHDITRSERDITRSERDSTRSSDTAPGPSRERHRTDSTLTVKSETLDIDSP